jgi:hypothetical protein
MRSSRIGLAAGILAMMAWASTPVFAGHDKGHGHKSEMSGSSHGKHGKKGHGHHEETDDNDSFENHHSNKGGAERGLDRANEVAGEHGEEGRENASKHHKK